MEDRNNARSEQQTRDAARQASPTKAPRPQGPLEYSPPLQPAAVPVTPTFTGTTIPADASNAVESARERWKKARVAGALWLTADTDQALDELEAAREQIREAAAILSQTGAASGTEATMLIGLMDEMAKKIDTRTATLRKARPGRLPPSLPKIVVVAPLSPTIEFDLSVKKKSGLGRAKSYEAKATIANDKERVAQRVRVMFRLFAGGREYEVQGQGPSEIEAGKSAVFEASFDGPDAPNVTRVEVSAKAEMDR